MGLVLKLLLIAVVAIVAVVLLNLSWFDEPLLPELEALRKPKPALLEGNAFVFALGFLVSFRTDPTAVFLDKAAQELAFWRMTLREAQLALRSPAP